MKKQCAANIINAIDPKVNKKCSRGFVFHLPNLFSRNHPINNGSITKQKSPRSKSRGIKYKFT